MNLTGLRHGSKHKACLNGVILTNTVSASHDILPSKLQLF